MKRVLVLSLLPLLLAGCASVAKEPDNLTLVQVLGIDGSGPVVFTAVSGDGQNGVSRGSARGDDFRQARGDIPWSGKGTELSVTGVSYLVLSEDADLYAVLMGVMEDSDLGASATVWTVCGSAAALLENTDDPAADLQLLTLKGTAAPTVAQALFALTTDGGVKLPCLCEKDGRVEEQGAVLWSGKN